MKKIIFCIIIFVNLKGIAQLHSGTPVTQSKPQPVPNATTSEKSAPPQPVNIPPAPNPVPPVYPGADVKAVEIPRQLINPPTTPSGTQPVQKEPLSPIESTNTLNPTRPPREQASRNNAPVSVPEYVPANSERINTRSIASNRSHSNIKAEGKPTSSHTSSKKVVRKTTTVNKKLPQQKSPVN